MAEGATNFSRDAQLRDYVLNPVVFTGRKLGVGSFGSVVEVSN